MNERRRPWPLIYLFFALVLMAVAHFWIPVVRLIDTPVTYVGALPFVAGIGQVLWCSRLFSRADTTIKPFERSSALVTHGPFAYSRNPIYLGMVVGLLGVALMFGTLTPFLVIPVFIVLIQRRVIRVEEAMLQEAFGSRYADYRKNVRRWI